MRLVRYGSQPAPDQVTYDPDFTSRSSTASWAALRHLLASTATWRDKLIL